MKSSGNLFLLKVSSFLLNLCLVAESDLMLFEILSDERISTFWTKGAGKFPPFKECSSTVKISFFYCLCETGVLMPRFPLRPLVRTDNGYLLSNSIPLLFTAEVTFFVDTGLISAIVSSCRVESSTALNEPTFKVG